MLTGRILSKKNKERLSKKARERYQNFSEKEEKKHQYEYRKFFSKIQEIKTG